MMEWEDRYIGVWSDGLGTEICVDKVHRSHFKVTVLRDGVPIARPWMNNEPAVDMPAIYTYDALDGSDFSVDLGPAKSGYCLHLRFVRRVLSAMSKTVVAVVTFVAGLIIGVLGLITVVANLGAFIGTPLASLSQPQLPESEAESLQRAAVVRELMFVSHLQKQAGILDDTGFMGIRFESPDATSQKFWKNLLGYAGSDAQVTILSNVYRTHDYFTEAFRTEASPDEAGRDIDENRTNINSRRAIVEPTYGAPPLRSFSGLARVSPQEGDELFIHFELTYVWADDRWAELVRSVKELPPQARDAALNDDSKRDATP